MTQSGVGDALTIASRLVLAAVFLFSASRKKYTGEEFVATMKAFGMPAPRLSAAAVTAVELALALTLAFWRREAWPSVPALVVLGVFTAVVAVKLHQGQVVPCPCFGAADRPISPATLIRNGWLAALAVIGTGSAATAEGGGIAVCAAILGVVTVAVILRTS